MFVTSIEKYLQTSSWLGILAISFLQVPAYAQRVVEDGTLPTRVKTTDNLNFTIDSINNKNRVGNNLFHSFKEFSIPTDGSAVFNNPTDVVNIINRVTGGNISNIDGLIKANGNANLFLINPVGIVFGKDARLDIGGSFFGSTANSIKFADGEFSAIDTTTEPLLSINVPLGLQMGSNSGGIEVQGDGYANTNNDSSKGLRVKSGNTLGLVGGKVSLNGGIVTASGIELGGVNSGLVNINSISESILNYDNVENFGDIKLYKMALADASGEESGSIQLQARNIAIEDGSKVFVQSRGKTSGGDIIATATDSIEVVGSSSDGNFVSTFLTETTNAANSAKIKITTPSLLVSQGGRITTQTFSSGRGGDITINASELIQISESSTIAPSNDSEISTLSFNSGAAGNINILTKQFSILGQDVQSRNFGISDGGNISVSADNLTILDGGGIASLTLGNGSGGDVKIDAKSIHLTGLNLDTFTPSVLSAATLGIGNAGNLTVNTQSLVVQDGGRVDSSTVASGKAGSVTVNATDFIEIKGTVPGSVNPSLIISSANIVDESLQQLFGLPAMPTGDSGNVSINTPILKVSDGAEVTVRNDGTGKGGILDINAKIIRLNNKGKITASTQSGGGGNIDLQVKDGLILKNQSLISAEAGGTGNGGNININSPVIAGVENSDIIANALQGNGGNININTSGLFGLQFRDELTFFSDITASSKFGVNGTVEINNPAIDPSSNLVKLPMEVVDSSQQMKSGCSANQGNSFTVVGKGGLPTNPADVITNVNLWDDLRNFNPISSGKRTSIQVNNDSLIKIVEATGWVVDEEGNIEFVAESGNRDSWENASNCKGEIIN